MIGAFFNPPVQLVSAVSATFSPAVSKSATAAAEIVNEIRWVVEADS